ncbi:MAG: DUF459 domain-containing protein [Acidimicrobiales bacterium]
MRVAVGLLALSMAAASVLAWQLASTPNRRAGSRNGRTTSARSGKGGGTPGRPTISPTTAPPATTAAAPTVPASKGPLRVLEIGDSLGVDLGEAMERSWPSPSVQLTMAARGDTGLANRSYYDWPSVLTGLLASVHPQVVVVLLGANDLQSMVTGSTVTYDGTSAWNAQYAARVASIVTESVRSGAHVLWVGEPAMQTTFINAGMTRIDGIAQKVVARDPGRAAYLSSSSVLAPGGSFSFDVTDPTGQQNEVRTPDGVHLMAAGADLLAEAAANALARDWGIRVAGS